MLDGRSSLRKTTSNAKEDRHGNARSAQGIVFTTFWRQVLFTLTLALAARPQHPRGEQSAAVRGAVAQGLRSPLYVVVSPGR